jgi:chromosome segregation ATPase
MNERLKEMRSERNDLLEEISTFERPTPAPATSSLSVELNAVKSELAMIANLLNTREKSLADEKMRHESTRRRLDQALTSLRNEATDPTEKRLRAEVRSLEIALADSERRASITAKERADLNYLRSRVSGLQSQLAAARNNDAELNRVRDLLRVTRAELVEAKSEEATAIIRSNNLKDKVGKLEASLLREQRESAGLRADNNRLRSNQVSARDLTELKAEILAVRSELRSANSKISNKSTKVSELQRDASALENALIAAERRADALAEDVKKLRQENRNLRERLDIRQASR